ncbi:MAG: four helix bundle protein [Candidatus Cloacimonadaceae bacterium]
MGINSEAILNHKFLEMAKLLNVYLNHFPRHEKYALANNIRNTAYSMYDLITECQKRYFKKTSLTELDIAKNLKKQ